jgi:PAS domain S-box-containing protein
MRAWLDTLLAPSGLTPHGFCLAWEPGLIWLYAISDSLIAISYYSIPIALLVVVRQRRDLAYPWVLWLFAAFIMACGTTHVFDSLTLWVPAYWPAGIAKALTAILSMVTALLLWPLIPKILALPSQTTMQIANVRLAESEARYRALFTQAPVAMYALNAAQRIAAVSDAWLDLFGYERGEVIGTPIAAFQVRTLADNPGEAPARDLERRFRCKSGKVLDVLISTSTPPAGHEGGLWRSISVVSDITARKRAEAALHETEARLRQSEKLTALGQLAGGIAHDFNNILQMVQSGASLIRHRAGDPVAVARLAGMVEEAASRGTSVSRRLLAFARREELRAEPIELPVLLRGLQEVLHYTLGAAIAVRLDVPASLPPVLADRGQLETVLVNLATNARDAMPAGGGLIMAARLGAAPANLRLPPGVYLRISITDTGAGMDPATLARAGEPFFTTKANGRGTGLGLSIARSFAEHSGGVMEITSTEGVGTTVDLWLPITPAAAALVPDIEVMPAAEPRRVLIVDDETLLREIVAEQLQAMGFEVHQAEDGNAALAVLASTVRIDVLVTDLSMPGIDGIALIRIAQSSRPDLPAILLTGYAGSVEPATEGASFSLMRKPVTGPQLARMVRGAVAA